MLSSLLGIVEDCVFSHSWFIQDQLSSLKCEHQILQIQELINYKY